MGKSNCHNGHIWVKLCYFSSSKDRNCYWDGMQAIVVGKGCKQLLLGRDASNCYWEGMQAIVIGKG